ncbi:nucleotide sugar dehydrogenase [bacterium]|nr:MAG: nucleotide sugar dehydrogenase [bacterium]
MSSTQKFGVVLEEKLHAKTATIGIIGLGYVGLPLAVEFAKNGYKTIGLDVSEPKVALLNAGKNYIGDVKDEDLAQVVADKSFYATTDYSKAKEIDVLYICVPTPITAYKDPDLSYIISATEAIQPHLRKDHLVILKSTTFPNTTEGYVQPILDKMGLKVGEDYFLAFSPERIDPGNTQWTTANTPIVVGGVTPRCTELASLSMRQVVGVIHEVSNPKVAEMEKLLENIFRAVNIALVNEMAQLCDRMGGVDIWEVVKAASTKPYGFMPFYPGPGLGGHCIPIDPYYLSWMARKYDFEANFITLAGSVNDNVPFYVVNKVIEVIANEPIRLTDAKVLILGAAFKKNVDDMRHSPALKIIEILQAKGFNNLFYHDPYVASLREEGFDLDSVELSAESLAEYDCVLLVTDHSNVNYQFIADHAKVVLDTRNAFASVKPSKAEIKLIGSGKF